MNASGNLATVLRIAARQAAADRRLERERAQAMVEYMVVVYVSFLVFLFIIAVLGAYLLPNLPTEGADVGNGGAAGSFSGFSEVQPMPTGCCFTTRHWSRVALRADRGSVEHR